MIQEYNSGSPPEYWATWEQVVRANENEGWTFGVRYDAESYLTAESWTRVQGLHLQEEALREAWELAQEWDRVVLADQSA
jgi:YD repeat-containing protein